jgi:DNA polymerase-1
MAKAKKYEKSYFIDMNIQSAPKPKSRDWFVRKADSSSIPEFTVCGWEFTLDRREDSIGISEGQDPKLNFRRVFLPSEGHYWVSRDFSGQELRILANLSQDETLINTFLSGGDPHKATAVLLWGEENYNSDKRKQAKAINFGLIYGKTAMSLADTLGISVKEAESYMETYFKRMPNIKKFLDKCELLASKNHDISNLYGRKRRLKSYINPWGNISRAGARRAYNHPIQSLGADIIKIALIKVYKNIIDAPMYRDKGLIYFLSTIHDEINFSVSKSILNEACYKIGKEMEHKIPGYPVPIITDLEIGNSMGLTWKFDQDLETLELTPRYEPLEEV